MDNERQQGASTGAAIIWGIVLILLALGVIILLLSN